MSSLDRKETFGFTALHLCGPVLAMSEMSVRLSNAWMVIKRKNFCRNSYTI